MEPLDATFVDCFLAFVNDKNASARKAESRFIKHPYTARLGIFNVDENVDDYGPLRGGVRVRLEQLLKTGFSDLERRELAKTLNDSQFDGSLLVESIQANGKRAKELKPVKIGAIVDYEIVRRRVVARVYPTISGMQQACEFALMLISNEPRRAKQCRLDGCEKIFNTQTSGGRFFCSAKHATNHEDLAKGIRAERSRKD